MKHDSEVKIPNYITSQQSVPYMWYYLPMGRLGFKPKHTKTWYNNGLQFLRPSGLVFKGNIKKK